MYELVNTSLPNGLIPGTHGFATVAMTKGLPDALRTRLETYCAYSHRTGAHDATYFKENPVNWFHVVLPQGEHVVGRVAPTEFDYTGRTNRLARLLVFPKGQMPAIGGVEVLKTESRRFVEPWAGEARWLEADRMTLGRLRLEMPTKTNDATAWRATFGGDEGVRLAKGCARLLAKNMAGNGKTIYFKTSAKHDIDGTKLLALFADLIALLPVDLRGKVTFSTYPAALPQGTVCHLRGVYDRDRIFDAAAVTQPWVDCENGTVHNASLLPPEEMWRQVVRTGTESELRSQTVTRSRQEVVSASSSAWRDIQLAAKRSDNLSKKFLRRRVIAVLVLVVVIVGSLYVFVIKPESERPRTNETVQNSGGMGVKTNKSLGTNNVKTPTNYGTNAVSAAEDGGAKDANTSKLKGGKTKGGVDEATGGKTNAIEKKADQNKHGGKDKIGRNTTNEAKTAEEQTAKTADAEKPTPKSSDKVAFANAKVKLLDELDAGVLTLREGHWLTNGTLIVFWYKDGVLTNAAAGYVPNRYSPRFENPKALAEENSRLTFLIWYDSKNEVAYWDWSPIEKRERERWFENADTVNMVELCFGTQKEVRETWQKSFGESFPIEYKCEVEKGKYTMHFDGVFRGPHGNEVLKVDDVVSTILKNQKSQQSNADGDLENTIKKYQKYEEQKKCICNAKKEYDSFTNQFVSVTQRLGNLKDKGGKKDASERKAKEELRAQRREWTKKIRNLFERDELKKCQSFLRVTLMYNNDIIITGWEELLKECEKQIGSLESKITEEAEQGDKEKSRIREQVKAGRYRIVKVGRK